MPLLYRRPAFRFEFNKCAQESYYTYYIYYLKIQIKPTTYKYAKFTFTHLPPKNITLLRSRVKKIRSIQI